MINIRLFAACVCALVFGGNTFADDAPAKEKWIQLFNGKDLSGWIPKIRGQDAGVNYKNTFRVKDGVLEVSYDEYDKFDEQFGHLFHERVFSDYHLRVEYRFVGEQIEGGPGWALRNSGLMLHGELPATMLKNQKFPASIEVQLLGGDGKRRRTTSNLCTPGTNVVMGGKLVRRHCTGSRSKTYHGEQWVSAEVVVKGSEITHILEGKVVLSYTEPQLDERDADGKRLLAAGSPKMLRKGTISLQSESHPVHFRKVEILPLGDEADPADWRDLLAGGDLGKNWETTGNWKLDKEGVVSLSPRPGEKGWSRFDAYLWLEGQYEDFELEFDYRVEKRGNSGFYFHVGDKKSPVAKGIEVQIYDSHPKGRDRALSDHDSGGIIPGIPPTANAAKAAGEWNHFHILSKGRTLTVKLNGEVVNKVDLDDPKIKGRPARGFIGFQDHALPLSLRKIRIREL